jgi:hypothetical protein
VGVIVEDNDGAIMERDGDHPIIVVATPPPAKARRATR